VIKHEAQFVATGARIDGHKNRTEDGRGHHQVDKLRVIVHHHGKGVTFLDAFGLEPSGNALAVIPQLLVGANFLLQAAVLGDIDKG
jgi:hypothetical protein